MGIQTHFIKFHNTIKLSKTDPAYTKARVKDDSVTLDVKAALKKEGYSVIEDFIQGSFSTDTAILKKGGDFDIDRAVVISFYDAPTNPVDPKKVVLGTLEKRGFKNATIKKPCVTADYSQENLHIDYPIYRERDNVYELAVGKIFSDENNREWSLSDPKGLKDWIKNNSVYGNSKSVKQQQFNRLVRYVKRWRDEQFNEDVCKKVYSIGLTVMLKECFVWNLDDDGKLDDLTALRDTVTAVLGSNYFYYESYDKYKVQVLLPKMPYRDIFHGSSVNTGSQLKNKLENMKSKLNEALKEGDEIKQCKILNKLFGDDFRIPDSSDTKKAVYSTSGAVGTSQGA